MDNNFIIKANCIILGDDVSIPGSNDWNSDTTVFFSQYFYKLNCALGWPKKIIYFHEVTSLQTDPNALSVLLETVSHQPWLPGQRPRIPDNLDAAIVFDGRSEALPAASVNNVIEFAKLHPTIPCYYISGAEPTPITFQYWKELKGDTTNLKLITENSFEQEHFDEGFRNYEHDFSVRKKKKFHFFIGKPRFHRYMLLALLAERKVLDKGILSYGWGGDSTTTLKILDVMMKHESEEYMNHFPNIFKVCKQQLPYLDPVACPYPNATPEDMTVYSRHMPYQDKAIYDNTWFQVSCETSNLTSTRLKDAWQVPSTIPLFITEKTYRPMLLKQIGVTCGQQGHLQGLKNKGFTPYEDYGNAQVTDMIYNDEERLIAQADAIEDMCQWPESFMEEKARDFAANGGTTNKNKIINSSINMMVHPH